MIEGKYIFLKGNMVEKVFGETNIPAKNTSNEKKLTDGKILKNSTIFYDLLMEFWGTGVRCQETLLSLLPKSAFLNVLDIGCGTGTLLNLLRREMPKTVELTGLDPSEQMIETANRKRVSKNIKFMLGAIEDIKAPDNTYDICIASFVLHHLPLELKERAIKEVKRVLKKGGTFVIADFGIPTTFYAKLITFLIVQHCEYIDSNIHNEVQDFLVQEGFEISVPVIRQALNGSVYFIRAENV